MTMSPRLVRSSRASSSMAVGLTVGWSLRPAAGVGAERGGARIGPDIRAPAAAFAELDVVDVRGGAGLEQRQQLMLGPIEAAHAGVGLGPDDEVEGTRPTFRAAEWTVGKPRQSMKVPKTPPSQRQGITASIHASLKARNSASVISPEAMANSRCWPPVTCPAIGTLYGSSVRMSRAGRVALHQPPERLRVGRAAAHEAVRSELKDVARASDGDRIGLGRKRALLDRLACFAEKDLVDFVEGKAGDLDRGVVKDQLLELNLELVEVPLALFSEAVDGEAQNALVGFAQMLHPDAGRTTEAEKPRSLDADRAVEDQVLLADEDRRAEAERADRVGDLAHMRGIELADPPGRHPQVFERNVREVERRQEVVAKGACRRRGRGQAAQFFASAAALRL